MALSNWDCCAWDEDGKPTTATFTKGNVSIEIYKNWAYLRDTDAWNKESSGYSEPTVMEIVTGAVAYKGFRIIATSDDGPDMADLDYLGDLDIPQNEKAVKATIHYEKWSNIHDNWNAQRDPMLQLYHGFFSFPDPIPTFEESTRYNQGDAFFAGAFEEPGLLQPTAPGKAQETVLGQMIGMERKDEE